MTTFHDKLVELIAIADADQAIGDSIRQKAEAFLDQSAGWPITTQVPLLRVAELLAGFTVKQAPNVRHIVASDALRVGDRIG